MCTSEDAVAVTSMSKELKQGFVMRYKKRLFGSNWRDGILTLHEDSTGMSKESGLRFRDTQHCA